MDDPGVPVMLGLLAVPVGVLLFVVTLALMGGRWTSPARIEEPEPVGETAAPGWGSETRPMPPDPPDMPDWPARDRALPAPRPLLALPPARPQYGAYSHGAQSHDRQSHDVYARDAHDTYSRDAYSHSQDVYARDAGARDAYEPEREPDVSPPPQAFPYGPYRHQ